VTSTNNAVGANRTGALTGRVREALESRIASGSLRPGQQLPTERELSEMFGVSRVTVRRAIASLAESGVVHAIQGRGTFVTSEPLAEPPNALLSFHDMVGENVAVSSRVIEATVRPATISEAENFQVAPGASLFALERLRVLDEFPVALDFTLVPVALESALPELDWEVASLYSALGTAGHRPVAADYSVEAQPADDRSAQLLGTAVGAPLLVADSRTYDPEGRLIVSGRISYRGDRYRFRSRLTAEQQVPGPSGRSRLV
jgi:GntR family transcriptional regulator